MLHAAPRWDVASLHSFKSGCTLPAPAPYSPLQVPEEALPLSYITVGNAAIGGMDRLVIVTRDGVNFRSSLRPTEDVPPSLAAACRNLFTLTAPFVESVAAMETDEADLLEERRLELEFLAGQMDVQELIAHPDRPLGETETPFEWYQTELLLLQVVETPCLAQPRCACCCMQANLRYCRGHAHKLHTAVRCRSTTMSILSDACGHCCC